MSAVHTDPFASCPACKKLRAEAARYAGSKVRKVYGRTTQNSRREHQNHQLRGRFLYERAYREHVRAMR